MPLHGAERALFIGVALLGALAAGCHRDRPAPSAPGLRLLVVTGSPPAVSASVRRLGLDASPARVRACRLALLARALDAAAVDQLADVLEQAREEAQPLALRLDDMSAGEALAAWQHDHADAWSAASSLSEPSWGAGAGTFRAAAVPACPPLPVAGAQLRCAAPSSSDPRIRRARLLAWPLVDGAVVSCAPAQRAAALAALRRRARRPGAVVGAVLSPVPADVTRVRRAAAALAPLARRGPKALAALVDVLSEAPDPSACGAVMREVASAIVVTPKLSMLVHASRLHGEIDAALAGTGARVSDWAR